MGTERIKVNDTYYDPISTWSLMKQRGITRGEETVSDALSRVVNTIANYDEKIEGSKDHSFIDKVRMYTEEGVFAFGTPVLTNLGREDLTVAACTVIDSPIHGNVLDIEQFRIDSMLSLDSAVGTGYDLSELTDPVSELNRMNEIINEINQKLLSQNKRPVACMATLRADHPKILEFVSAKNNVDFAKWRFNISVFVTEELFLQAEKNGNWDLIDENNKTTQTISAQYLLEEMARCAHYCGEPGILFADRFDRDNPTPQWKYKSTAPCAEVAMAPGEVCQFSYINLTNLFNEQLEVDYSKLMVATMTMTRALDNIVQQTIENDFFTHSLIQPKRRIGIGVTGFAGLLVNLGIPYDSDDAIEIAHRVSEIVEYSSKRASVELAKRRGRFPAYLASRFLDKEWVRRKQQYQSGVLKQSEWKELYEDIDKYGVRNASTTAYPPTGTSSQLVSTSTSFEPYYELVQWKSGYQEDSKTPVIYSTIIDSLKSNLSLERLIEVIQFLYAPNNPKMLSSGEFPHLRTATQISPDYHLRIQAAFQTFADESSSKTINLAQSEGTSTVLKVIWQAYRSNLKGVTVFRTNCLSERETISE